MSYSINEQLNKNLKCENIFECLFDLNELDKKCYELLIKSESPKTIKEISQILNRDQSTINRSISRLDEESLVEKEKETYSKGGYSYIYTAKSSEEVSSDMRNIIKKWNTMMDDLITEFESKY